MLLVRFIHLYKRDQDRYVNVHQKIPMFTSRINQAQSTLFEYFFVPLLSNLL